jgi:SAM-dependent methyltransferase
MNGLFSILSGRLHCPDDQVTLQLEPTAFHCPCCARSFPIIADNFVELLPKNPTVLPAEFGPKYLDGYLREFHRPFAFVENPEVSEAAKPDKNAPARNDVLFHAQVSARSWVQKREREVDRVLALLVQNSGSPDSILCDISAGPGYYTFAYASRFSVVLHCDLAVDSLAYAMRKAAALKLNNVLFLRIDYFAPPFKNSLDQILCLDTLIRGRPHEAALLLAINHSLTPRGYAIVDFHNWWHNPLRRMGLMSQTFDENQSYSRRAAEGLLAKAGVAGLEYFPFFQEFDHGELASKFLGRIIPPTRLIYRFSSSREAELPRAGTRSDRPQATRA